MKWALALWIVVVPVTAFIVSSLDDPVYRATATVRLGPVATMPTPRKLERAAVAARDDAASLRVADIAGVSLDPPMSAERLQDVLAFNVDRRRYLLRITASAGTGATAATIADAQAKALQRYRTEVALAPHERDHERTLRQLRRTGAEAEFFVSENDRYRATRAWLASGTEIVVPASTASSKASPRPRRTAARGLATALLLAGAGLVALARRRSR